MFSEDFISSNFELTKFFLLCKIEAEQKRFIEFVNFKCWQSSIVIDGNSYPYYCQNNTGYDGWFKSMEHVCKQDCDYSF